MRCLCSDSSLLEFLKQDMAVRALKQTGSRNIEAALEYISKMSYLDPHNEQIVRVIKQTSPGMCTLLKTIYIYIMNDSLSLSAK